MGGVIAVEALTTPFKKEEYPCSLNKMPDIPAENFFYSPLPYTGMVAGTTGSSGDMVIL
jgi:hypothetical protein